MKNAILSDLKQLNRSVIIFFILVLELVSAQISFKK